MDIKNIARILYDNRTNSDYRTNQGSIRILAQNGVKLSKRTFESHSKEIKAAISELHDIEFGIKTNAQEKKELEALFSKKEYVEGLKKVWSGHKFANKIPSIRDALQAGRQISEFFGWNINEAEQDGMFKLQNGKVQIHLHFGNRI